MPKDAQDIIKVPAPWQCTAQVYSLVFFSKTDSESVKDMSAVAYSPLELSSYFASPEAGRLTGGLGGLMILRYTDSPVGPYDELLVIPGSYVYPVEEQGKLVERENMRISRIYVSQKHTLFNGRHSECNVVSAASHLSPPPSLKLDLARRLTLRADWNIPKHLAHFVWEDLPNGATQVKVFPRDTDGGEAAAEPTPLFKASFKTIPFIPSFPMSTSWAKYVGLDLSLVQPPVPQGVSEEIVGTNQWCKSIITQYSSRMHLGWFNISQRDEHGDSGALFENFWPGLGQWQLGVKMDNAAIEVPEGEYWHSPTRTP